MKTILSENAQRGKCRACGAEIFWDSFRSGQLNGKMHPFNPDGSSHFDTCPDAAEFRRPPALVSDIEKALSFMIARQCQNQNGKTATILSLSLNTNAAVFGIKYTDGSGYDSIKWSEFKQQWKLIAMPKKKQRKPSREKKHYTEHLKFKKERSKAA